LPQLDVVANFQSEDAQLEQLRKSVMSVIAAAYSSYTTWSISQSGTAAMDADTGKHFRHGIINCI
jgi:hypothetical protein